MNEWLKQLLEELGRGESDEKLLKKYTQLQGDMGTLKKVKAAGLLMKEDAYDMDRAITSTLGEDFKAKHLPKPVVKQVNQADYGGDPFQKAIGVKKTTDAGTATAVATTPVNPTVDPEFEKNIAESNKRYDEFNKRLAGKMVGTANGDVVVPYGYQAPIDRQEAYPELKDYKQGDIVEYRKSKFAPTGYKQLQDNQWVDVVRPKKTSGFNEEVVVKAVKPKMAQPDIDASVKKLTEGNDPLKEYVELSESDKLKEKLALNPDLAKAVSDEINQAPTKARTGDGRMEVFEKAVVKNYKLDSDPFVVNPTVDHAEFQKNIKQSKDFQKLQELSKEAVNLAAKYKLDKSPQTAEAYNAKVKEMQEYKPLVEYFAREDVSNVLHLMALQERGQQELSSGLNLFPGYRERKLEAEDKKLRDEGGWSGAGKSVASGTLDMISNIVYGGIKSTPMMRLIEEVTGMDKVTDRLKDNYDQWSQATFTTGTAKNDFLSFANEALKMSPQMAAIMITKNPTVGGALFIATPAFGASYKESLTQGLTEEQAYAKGVVDAGIEWASESIVPDKALVKGFKPSKMLSDLGAKGFGTREFNKVFRKELSEYLATKPGRLAEDYLGQMTEEVVAMKAGQASNAVANALTGSKFETSATGEEEKNLMGSMALITLGTKAIGKTVKGFESGKSQGYRDIILRNAADDFKGAQDIVDMLKSDPDQNPKLVQKIENDLTRFAAMKFRDGNTPEQKVVVFKEISKLRELEKEKENTEKELHEPINEKIKAQQEKINLLMASPKLAKEQYDESIASASEDINKNAAGKGEAFASVAEQLTGKAAAQVEAAPVQDVIKKVNNAEYVNENDLKKAEDELYDALEKNPEAAHLIEPLIQKIQNYEFTTETKTRTTTEKVPTERTTKTKITTKPALEQSAGATVEVTNTDGTKTTGVLKLEDGNYHVVDESGNKTDIGEKAINDRDLTLPKGEENPVELDEDGNVKSITLQTRDGKLVKVQDAEKALDIAIQLHVQEMGEIPAGAFQTVYDEVEKQVQEEVPKPIVEKPAVAEEKPKPTTTKKSEPVTGKKKDEEEKAPARKKRLLPAGKQAPETFTGKDIKKLNKAAKGEPRVKVQKVYATAAKVLRAMRRLIPDLNIKVHHTLDTYTEDVLSAGGTKEDAATSGGFYIDREKKQIHINISGLRKEADEVFHEAAHPILDMLVENNPEAIGKMFDELKALEDILPGVTKAIQFGQENYTDPVTQKAEAIVQFMAMVADGEINVDDLTPSALNRVADFIKNFLNKIGFNYKLSDDISKEDALVDVARKFSTAIKQGKSIGFHDQYKSKDGKKLTHNDIVYSAHSSFDDLVSGVSYEYLKNSKEFQDLVDGKFVTNDKMLSSWAGKWGVHHLPDHMFTGNMYWTGESKPLVKGEGGLYFTMLYHNEGIVWAANSPGTAEAFIRSINAGRENSGDGIARIFLVSSNPEKLLNSTAGANGFLDILKSKAFDERMKLDQQDVADAIRIAAKNWTKGYEEEEKAKAAAAIAKGRKPKSRGVEPPILRVGQSLDSIVETVKHFNRAENGSFDDRNVLNEMIADQLKFRVTGQKAQREILQFFHKIGGIKPSSTGESISKQNILTGIGNLMSEPMLKGIPQGHIYAVIEVPSDLEPVEMPDKHTSYKWGLKAKDKDARASVHILQDRELWYDQTLDPSTGELVTKDRLKKVFPNYGYTHKPIQITPDVQTKSPQFVNPNIAFSKSRPSEQVATNFEAREKVLSSQHVEQNTREQRDHKDSGRTDVSKVGGLDRGREGTEVGHGASSRYVVGRSDRVLQDVSVVKRIRIPDAEASSLKEAFPNDVFDESFSEINSAEQFHKAISSSLPGNKWSASVFVYPVEEYKTSRLFLTDDAKAGVAITNTGDIISVFSYGEGKNRVHQLLIHAVRNGGVSLDHYDTRLTDYYSQLGFVPTARVKFNREFAPENWDTKLYKDYNNGEPDVIAMAYHGGDPATIHERAGRFGSVTPLVSNTPYVEEWDQAKKLQAEYVAKVKKTKPAFSKSATLEKPKTKARSIVKTKSVEPFEGKDGEKNYNKWKGKNKEVRGSEIQDVKTGEPIVAKVYHGTTHEFYEFDSTVKGNVEGHLGKINYFTSDYQDASMNYLSEGADITSRVDREQERIEQELEKYTGAVSGLDMKKVKEDYNITNSELKSLYPSGVPKDISASELSRHIAEKQLKGGEEKVLELYTKLNNPVVLGKGATWVEVIPESEYADSLEEAAQEVADENDIDIEEAKSDRDFEIRERAIELSGAENKIQTALADALDENGYKGEMVSEILGDEFYETEVDLNKLEKKIRKAELYDNTEGDLASSQVIADFFKNLGYDGIILTDVSERFKGMHLGRDTSHVHVFDEYANQIKLADGSNVDFGTTKDIRFSKSKQAKNIRQRYLDDFNLVEDSKFDWRVKSILSTVDRKKAVADIKAGKDTAAARKLNTEIDEAVERGTVIINRGRGTQAETVEIPIDEWFGLSTKEQDQALNEADEVMDEAAAIIRDNDITLQNIDDLKHLFDGFPYNQTDFKAVKDFLSGQGKSDDQTKESRKEGKGEKGISFSKSKPASLKELGVTKSDTATNFIDKLIAHNGEFTDMLKMIKADPKFNILKLEPYADLAGDDAGLYHPLGGKKGGLIQIANRGDAYYNGVHEFRHFLTIDSAAADKAKNTPAYNALDEMYQYIAAKKGKPGFLHTSQLNYGLANFREFMAELQINEDFREYVGDVFADNLDDIKKNNKAIRASGAGSFTDLIRDFFKELFTILSGRKESGVAFDKSKPVVENASKLATELFFPEQPPAPSFSKSKRDASLQSEVDAIRKSVKGQLQGAKNAAQVEAVKDKIRQEVEAIIKGAKDTGVFTGNVKSSLLAAVVKKLNQVKTPYQMLKFADYFDKTLNNVEYDKDVQVANTIRKKIRKAVKSKVRDASRLTKDVVDAFLRVKPDNTTDIKEYVEIANKILGVAEGVKVRTGAAVKNAEFGISHKEISKYTEDQLEYADKKAAKRLSEMHADLVQAGLIDPDTMNAKEMKSIIDTLAGDNEDAIKDAAAGIEEKMEALKGVAEYGIESLNEYMEGDPDLTPAEKEVVGSILKIDLDKLTGIQLAKIIDVINNIVVNDNFVGSGDIAVYAKMREDAAVLRTKLKSYKVTLKELKNVLIKSLSSTALLFDFITKHSKAAAEIQRLSGISGIFNGNATARSLQAKAVEGYNKLKKKMGGDIDTAINKYRRGVYADVMNNFGGTEAEQQAEFERRVNWVRVSADRLMASSVEREWREGKLLDHVYNELLADAESIDDVKAKMQVLEPNNIRLVQYWQDTFAERWPMVSENAEIYNNRTTEDVENYTATVLKGVDNKGQLTNKEIDILAQTMMAQNLRVNPAGTKITKTRAKQPPPNRVLNFDFDTVQSKKYFETNYDIETSKHIAQAKAFLESEEAHDLLGGSANTKMTAKNLNKSIGLQRGNNFVEEDELARAFEKKLHFVQAKSVRMALFSIAQWPKQYIGVTAGSLFNLNKDVDLIVKSWTLDINDPLFDMFNIGQRGGTQAGMQKQVTAAEIEQAFIGSTTDELVDNVMKASAWVAEGLASTLVKADVRAARRAWYAYYMKSLRDQGIDVGKLDMSKEHLSPNKQAAAYAEQMVSRSQNPNDPTSMANIYKQGNDAWWNIIKNVALPFSSFSMNMRLRMTNDVQKLFGVKGVTAQGRKEAAWSLLGSVVEQFVFNYIKIYFIGQATTWGSEMLGKLLGWEGGDDDKDEDEEAEKRRKRWVANTVSDLFFGGMGTATQSWLQEGVNLANRLTQVEVRRNDKVVKIPDIYYQPNKSFFDYMGLYGIAPKKVIEAWKDGKLAITGQTDKITTYGKDYETKKISLTDEEEKVMIYLFVMDALGLAGLSDAEVSQANNKLRNTVRKQMDKRTGTVEEDVDIGHPPKKR